MGDTFTMTAPDGTAVTVYRWLPAGGTVSAVVQISHGASEHAKRYARLAGVLNDAGYAVYADDHRGHGTTAGTAERAGIAGGDAWEGMVADTGQLLDLVRDAHPGVPVALLGHSMGSFIVQDFLPRSGDRLAAVILSGTTGTAPAEAEGLAERVEASIERLGRDVPSEDFGAMFVDFNDRFVDSAPGGEPTGFEWLSRDPDEVRLYVDDPWCGFPLSNGFVLDMARSLEGVWEGARDGAVPKHLPVLIIAGDEDPVGRYGEGVRELTARYRNVGLDVTEILYPGARHEVFNETNRDEVHRDVVAWLKDKLGS